MNLEKIKNDFINNLERMKSLENAVALFHWDAQTGAPKKGADIRAKTLGILSSEIYSIMTCEDMKNNLLLLEENYEKLDDITKALVYNVRKDYNKMFKIPAEDYKAYTELCSRANVVWEEAKEKSDYSIFEPYFEKIVYYLRKFVSLRGYKDHPYNTLLDDYEPGMTVEKLDEFLKH